jgi:valyl-tRNA synthetase
MDKRYDHIAVEKEMQQLWKQQDTYKFGKKGSKKVFSIDTPPPTVSGNLHIGHIFSYTHTDLIARYKRMQGFDVFYPMGFDDNGLPTEKFAEKKHKITASKMKRSEFIQLCLEESKKMGQTFAEFWQKLGLSIDWTNTYSTISDEVRKISQLSFLKLFKQGTVYKKEEPVQFCTRCGTTVAQAELEDVESESFFNDIQFKTSCGKPLIIATTRPELLPACVALFCHPSDSRYTNLKGKKAIVPIFKQEVPIIFDEHVSIEKGSGLVMCCTFGDRQDVEWFKTHGLPVLQVIGRDGKMIGVGHDLDGLHVTKARKSILKRLEEAGELIAQKPIKHCVNTHDRCGTEIEYLILNQWFVRVLENKDKFLAAADEIKWKPEHMKSRYIDWVKNLKWDWCISRQRFYAVPFPVWYCSDCGKVLLPDEKDLPVDPQEQKYSGSSCRCGGVEVLAETDVMDTWNTSSLTPQICVGWPNESDSSGLKMPMSLRPQAHDIIRTWAFYTIIKSFYHNGCAPWKQIAISGYVVAQDREKISKSKGNAPMAPEKLLEAFSSDSVRYWTANGRLGVDTAFSEKQIKVGQRLSTKLWNAFRFCKDLLGDFDSSIDVKFEPADDLDKWVCHKMSKATSSYIRHFEFYEHSFALEVTEDFFWNTFCDNYIELVKDRIFNPQNYDTSVIESTKKTVSKVCFLLLQMLAPFIPHITEKLFQMFFAKSTEKESLHLTILSINSCSFDFSAIASEIDLVVKVVSKVRRLKSEANLSLKTEVEVLCFDATATELKKHESLICGVTKAKKIEWVDLQIKKSKLDTRDSENINISVKTIEND